VGSAGKKKAGISDSAREHLAAYITSGGGKGRNGETARERGVEFVANKTRRAWKKFWTEPLHVKVFNTFSDKNGGHGGSEKGSAQSVIKGVTWGGRRKG